MADGYLLSEGDREVLQKLLDNQNAQKIQHSSQEQIFSSPEVYVAKVLDEENSPIPALTEAAEGESYDHPGCAPCQVYQILPGESETWDLTPLANLSYPVFNITGSEISGGWFLVIREKSGKWVALPNEVIKRFELKEALAGESSATAYELKLETETYTIGETPVEFTLYNFIKFWSGYGRDGETPGTRGWCKLSDGRWEVIGTDGPVIGALTVDLAYGGTAQAAMSIGGDQTVTVNDGCIPADQKIPSGTKIVMAIINSKWYVISSWLAQDVVTEVSSSVDTETGEVSFSAKTMPVTILAKGDETTTIFGESTPVDVVVDVRYESKVLKQDVKTVQVMGATALTTENILSPSKLTAVTDVAYDSYNDKFTMTKTDAYVFELASGVASDIVQLSRVEVMTNIRHQEDADYIEKEVATYVVIPTTEPEWQNAIATTDCEDTGTGSV